MTEPFKSLFVDQPDLIPDEETLYRVVAIGLIQWEDRDEDGNPAIKSSAFQNQTLERAQELGVPGRCMSVGVDGFLRREGLDPERMLEGLPAEEAGLVAFEASLVRQLGDGIMHWPYEPNAPWHAVVFCSTSSKRTKGNRRALARAARSGWVDLPPAP